MRSNGLLRVWLGLALVVGLGVMGTGEAGAVTMTFWEGIDHAIAYDAERVPVVDTEMNCAQLEYAEATALTIQSEQRAMGADLEKLRGWITEEIGTYSTNLAKSISGVSGAIDRLAGLVLHQDHVEAFNNILRDLRADLGLANRYVALNKTLLARVQNTLIEIENAMSQKCRPTPLTAVFTPARYTTVYTEHVIDPKWSYHWTVSIPADPGCATGFTPNDPLESRASWYHADTDIGGPCVHANGGYSNGVGHPGIVTLIVTSTRFVCTLTYHGTLTGTGGLPECITKK